jgi:hypothetical protein
MVIRLNVKKIHGELIKNVREIYRDAPISWFGWLEGGW